MPPSLRRILLPNNQLPQRYSSRCSTTSSRTSMDSKLKDEPRRPSRTLRNTRRTRSRRSAALPQRADRSASRHRAVTSARRWTSSTSSIPRPITAGRSAALRRRAGQDRSQQAAPPHGVEPATEQHVQQVAPPLSGVEQTEPKDEIAAIFDESVRSLKAFSGELLHDFKHRLGRDRASSLPARGDQDRAPGGHLRKPVTQQKRTRRRGETRRAAHRTAREEATQARASSKEATDCEEAPPTDSEARQRTIAAGL